MRKSAKNQLSKLNIFKIMAKTEQKVKDLNAEKQPQVRPAKADNMFSLVKNGDEVRIAIGNFQISRKVFKSWQEAEDYLYQKPYEIIINTACLFAEQTIKQHEKK